LKKQKKSFFRFRFALPYISKNRNVIIRPRNPRWDVELLQRINKLQIRYQKAREYENGYGFKLYLEYNIRLCTVQK
jgi:hypothetical protein